MMTLKLHIHAIDLQPLTNSQIEDLFNYVFNHGKATDNDNQFTLLTCNATEEVLYSDEGCDYYSVFMNNGWPVAAAAPLESLFRIMI